MALGTYPAFKANSIRELIDLAKARPGELSYGAAGVGSGGHLAGEIFKSAAGIDIVPISYKGGNIAMLEVMAVGITRPTGRSRRAIAVRARSRNSSS